MILISTPKAMIKEYILRLASVRALGEMNKPAKKAVIVPEIIIRLRYPNEAPKSDNCTKVKPSTSNEIKGKSEINKERKKLSK